MSEMEIKEQYNKIFILLTKKREESIENLINFIIEDFNARELCSLVDNTHISFVNKFILTDFELHLFHKKESELKSLYELEDVELMIDNIKSKNKLEEDNINKLEKHLKTVNKKNKIDYSFIKEESYIKDNFNKEEVDLFYFFTKNNQKNIHLFSIKLINDIIDRIILSPKFALDHFNNSQYLNFLFDRNFNINNYNKLNDFFKEYSGDSAMESENHEWISLSLGNCYKKEIELYIQSQLNEHYDKNLKDSIVLLYTENIYNKIRNINTTDIFKLYEINENKINFKQANEQAIIENEIDYNVEEFLKSISNKNEKTFHLYTDFSEEYKPPTENNFNINDFAFLKELNYRKKKEFINNFSYYYCDANNINLFYVLEKTNLFDNKKQILKVNCFYLFNKNIYKISKDKLDKTLMSKKTLNKYKIIFKNM
jgi:hypothetical protein